MTLEPLITVGALGGYTTGAMLCVRVFKQAWPEPLNPSTTSEVTWDLLGYTSALLWPVVLPILLVRRRKAAE